MKQFYLSLLGLLFSALILSGQNYLKTEEGIKVAYFTPESKPVQAFDVNLQYFYYNDEDTIYQVDPFQAGEGKAYGKPADYEVDAYPTFLNISPDGSFLWAGYSDLANEDARIYRVDVVTGEWKQMAKMPSNWDLAFWNEEVLVSGLNSADFMTPSGIYLLDTTGADAHRKIVDVGGSSAGMALDDQGNLYFGTSSFTDPNALYRLNEVRLRTVIEDDGAAPLEPGDAEKLTALPMGLYDCEVDDGGNVLFTMNLWGGTNVLGQWNGVSGAGNNFDTLAVSTEWLGMIKTRGDYTAPYLGNSIFTLGYGQAVADLHTVDYPPRVLAPLPVLTGYENQALDSLDLSLYMIDLDDPGGMSFSITVMSEEAVADLSIEGDTLTGSFGMAGQSNLVIEGSSGGYSVSNTTLVGTWPQLEGDYLQCDFENFNLEAESYWNGSDGKGSFSTGPARFHNAFDTEYYSWSGWSYSNTSDVTTPGYINQYSAITGAGFPGREQAGGVYGVSSKYGPVLVDFPEKAYAPEGFYVTNSSYATLSMEQGDWAAKQFGGADGTEPDFFKMMVWGFRDSTSTDTIEYYLADYRFDDAENDYIIKTWQWVDLSAFGKVDSLSFGLESSDNGDWGMNTPAYFCMDELLVHPDAAPHVVNPLPDFVIYSDGSDSIIDISSVFTDPDDEDSLIVKSLVPDTHEGPLMAELAGDSLILRGTCWLVKSSFIDLELILEGSLGGLSAADTFLVHVECVGAIKENSLPEVLVYPNPGHGEFILDFTTDESLEVSVYSYTGALVYSRKAFQPGGLLDLSMQPAGAFIIRIRYSDGVISKMIQNL